MLETPRLGGALPEVLAIPRGGVPVAFHIATALRAPLDVIVARELGAPGHPEMVLGAIAEGCASCVDLRLVSEAGVSSHWVDEVMDIERTALLHDVRLYRESRPFPDVYGRPVVLVDDGLSSVVTLRAAARALRVHAPERVVLALPVCSPKTHSVLTCDVDDVVCAAPPAELAAFGIYGDYFSEPSDRDVLRLLDQARETTDGAPAPLDPTEATRRLRPRSRPPSAA